MSETTQTCWSWFWTTSVPAIMTSSFIEMMRDNGIGKVMAMGKCDKLKDHASAFLTPNQSHDNVNKQWSWPNQVLLHKGQNVERLKPVKKRMNPAPASLLKLLKCNCHGKCDKNSCSCHKKGLLCTLTCGQCKRITCNNAAVNNEAEHLGGHADW